MYKKRMKTATDLLIMVISVLLIFSMAACNDQPAPITDPTPPTEIATLAPATVTQAPEVEVIVGQRELIPITGILLMDTVTQNKFMTELGESVDDNRWNTLIANELGYDFSWNWVATDSDQYNQKFNASVAAGDVPDVVHLINRVHLKQCVDAGLLVDIGPYYEEYASPLLKSIQDDAGPYPRRSCTFDGLQYALPCVSADIEYGALLFVRDDLMQKTDITELTTVDEMIDLAVAFKELLGAGSVGLAIDKDCMGKGDNFKIDGLMYAYGAYPNMWVERDGKLVFGNTLPEFKEGLAKLKEIYDMGLIDMEFIVKDNSKVSEDIIAGKNGIFYGAHWTPLWPLQNNINADPEADWIPYNLPAKEKGKPVYVGIQMATNDYFAASKFCTNPEAVIQLCNLYCDKTFDPVLQEYEYYSNPGGDTQALWKLSPVYMMTPNKNIDTTIAIRPHLESGDPGGLWGEQYTMWEYSFAGQNGDRLNWGWNRVNGVDSTTQIQWEQQILPGYTYMDRFYGAPTDTMSTRKNILEKAFLEEVVKIIAGQSPIDAFDAAVKAWEDGGGTLMTEEANAWYQTQ